MRHVPEKLTAGLTARFPCALDLYSPPIWSLKLIARGPVPLDLSAVPLGTGFQFEALGTETASWTAGVYGYELRVEDGADVVCVEAGNFEVIADLSQAAADHDPRSPSQIALDNIDAVIAKRATKDQERYKINDRELQRTPIADLLTLREFYRKQVAQEQRGAKRGRLLGRTVKLRFS